MGSQRIASFAARTAASGLLLVFLVLLVPAPAAATWSVAATDPDTGEVGVALASCVPAEILGRPDQALVPLVLVPGAAAAVTQGQLNLAAPDRIVELASAGTPPADIVAELSSASFDQQAELRQHAVVDLDGNVAAFTGSGTSAEALDRQSPNVSVQGNLLVSASVVTEALDRFVADRAGGADLASALVAALLAGSRAGGDRRCGAQTALFAQVAVAGTGDSGQQPPLLLTVQVDEGDGRNPVELLASSFAAGERGAVDAGAAAGGRGGQVRLAVLVACLVLVVAGGAVFRRGLGSRQARR